jgi:hypothetical protein
LRVTRPQRTKNITFQLFVVKESLAKTQQCNGKR